MQEVYHDGTGGEIKKADTLEELLPEIKKSLKKNEVDYVKIYFVRGDPHFKAEERINELKAILGPHYENDKDKEGTNELPDEKD